MATKRETQTSFEEHPDAGEMMLAAMTVARISQTREELKSLQSIQREAVAQARHNGVSWQTIANALGVTRSAAQQHYGH
jgi:DNA-directed RNA polymerase specialized sigma24 family protein